MKRGLETTEEAYSDVAEAWTWYEDRQDGLGDRFMVAYREALHRIQRTPEMYPEVRTRVRRAMMRRFPYGVYYLVQPDRVIVVAVLHDSRDPQVWQGRVEE